jgi:hypothetical protein
MQCRLRTKRLVRSKTTTVVWQDVVNGRPFRQPASDGGGGWRPLAHRRKFSFYLYVSLDSHGPEARYQICAVQGVVRGANGAGIPEAVIRLRVMRPAMQTR